MPLSLSTSGPPTHILPIGVLSSTPSLVTPSSPDLVSRPDAGLGSDQASSVPAPASVVSARVLVRLRATAARNLEPTRQGSCMHKRARELDLFISRLFLLQHLYRTLASPLGSPRPGQTSSTVVAGLVALCSRTWGPGFSAHEHSISTRTRKRLHDQGTGREASPARVDVLWCICLCTLVRTERRAGSCFFTLPSIPQRVLPCPLIFPLPSPSLYCPGERLYK